MYYSNRQLALHMRIQLFSVMSMDKVNATQRVILQNGILV